MGKVRNHPTFFKKGLTKSTLCGPGAIFSTFFKKTLDNWRGIWYTIGVERGKDTDTQ